jgi:hypothetical protein
MFLSFFDNKTVAAKGLPGIQIGGQLVVAAHRTHWAGWVTAICLVGPSTPADACKTTGASSKLGAGLLSRAFATIAWSGLTQASARRFPSF